MARDPASAVWTESAGSSTSANARSDASPYSLATSDYISDKDLIPIRLSRDSRLPHSYAICKVFPFFRRIRSYTEELLGDLSVVCAQRRHSYPRRARSALGVDTVLTLDVCMFVCMLRL